MSESIGRRFMELTTYQHAGLSQQKQGLPQPPLQLPPGEGQAIIPLPPPADTLFPSLDLRCAIEGRRSLRQYSEDPISLDELSMLLWLTQGVEEVTDRPATLRPVPSAGARHAFETYLVVQRVTSLDQGLYRFLAIGHQLVAIDIAPDWVERLAAACPGQKQIQGSAVAFIWTAVLERMVWRYGERGYRYLHLDAGHVCQNLFLAAEAIACGVCAIGAFDDEKTNALLGLDGSDRFTVYMATLGKK